MNLLSPKAQDINIGRLITKRLACCGHTLLQSTTSSKRLALPPRTKARFAPTPHRDFVLVGLHRPCCTRSRRRQKPGTQAIIRAMPRHLAPDPRDSGRRATLHRPTAGPANNRVGLALACLATCSFAVGMSKNNREGKTKSHYASRKNAPLTMPSPEDVGKGVQVTSTSAFVGSGPPVVISRLSKARFSFPSLAWTRF